jgi:hypothetical protein
MRYFLTVRLAAGSLDLLNFSCFFIEIIIPVFFKIVNHLAATRCYT